MWAAHLLLEPLRAGISGYAAGCAAVLLSVCAVAWLRGPSAPPLHLKRRGPGGYDPTITPALRDSYSGLQPINAIGWALLALATWQGPRTVVHLAGAVVGVRVPRRVQ